MVGKQGLDNGRATRAIVAVTVGMMRTTIAIRMTRPDRMMRVVVVGGEGSLLFPQQGTTRAAVDGTRRPRAGLAGEKGSRNCRDSW